MHRVRTFSNVAGSLQGVVELVGGREDRERTPGSVRTGSASFGGRCQVRWRAGCRPFWPAVWPRRIPAFRGRRTWDRDRLARTAALQQAMTASGLPASPPTCCRRIRWMPTNSCLLQDSQRSTNRMPGWARELDVATGLWSTPAAQQSRTALETPGYSSLAVACWRHLRSLARSRRCEGRRGGVAIEGVGPQDRAIPGLEPVWPAHLRLANAVGPPGRRTNREPILWAPCTIEQVGPGTSDTGFSPPLPAGWESSLEVLALRVALDPAIERLTLNSTAQPAVALGGLRNPAVSSAGEKPGLPRPHRPPPAQKGDGRALHCGTW